MPLPESLLRDQRNCFALGLRASLEQKSPAMPIHWTIAPLEHMVVCVFEGTVTLDDVVSCFSAIGAAGASAYRKIMDATNGECTLSASELETLTALVKAAATHATPGPVAIVTGSSGNDTVVRNFRTITPRGRPLRTFSSIHAARRWLNSQPLGGGA